ncbi:hypothetical protein RHMOL_Rhmol12G0047600 [Rhododendron molle]|uniref:Uncharacterized protein n=1 Tax=Rhododendron molle TaxID=49168 RepID=A0ACC0LFD6_RHOML|nr:hypothetical protein RHMOL_Rhmol12G0047600 [Rhododendron molle]
MTTDTTDLSYWLNWRFFTCAVFIFGSMVVSVFVIWKNEGFKKSKTEGRHNWQDTAGILYKDETWRTSLKVIRPGWLLAYRVTAFIVLLSLLILNVVLDGGGIFYYYTQWTFSLVTLYFGLASLFSIHGCRQCCHEAGGARVDQVALDAERGTYVALSLEENANKPSMSKSLHSGLNSHEEYLARKTAGIWGYIFQIIYQVAFSDDIVFALPQCAEFGLNALSVIGLLHKHLTSSNHSSDNRQLICAGAVVLTDCVFWFIIFPFLTSDDYSLDFIDATFHSLNAVLLLGDVVLNCLRFPFFRITYFIQWTGIYVIFQWIVHACVSMWWPYPFLDLSTPYAPIWYLAVGLLHLPCYGVFALIIRLKNYWLSIAFPDAIQI